MPIAWITIKLMKSVLEGMAAVLMMCVVMLFAYVILTHIPSCQNLVLLSTKRERGDDGKAVTQEAWHWTWAWVMIAPLVIAAACALTPAQQQLRQVVAVPCRRNLVTQRLARYHPYRSIS